MLALCLFAIWQSSLLALTDKLGPGPGLLSVLAVADRLGLLARAADRRHSAQPADPPDAEPILPHGYGARRIGAIVGTLAVTTLLMELLGFRLAMLGLQRRPAGRAGRAALDRRSRCSPWLGSFGVYYVFTTWLDVLLPVGLFGL